VTVRRIQDNLKATKLCQESYANKRRRPLEFEVGDHVYLHVFTDERCEEVWDESQLSILLYWTLSHPGNMWTRNILVGHTTIIAQCSRHVPCVTTEEVFEGTLRCSASRSDTTRGRLVISSVQSRYWIRKIVSRGRRLSSSIRCNGATILKKKPFGLLASTMSLVFLFHCASIFHTRIHKNVVGDPQIPPDAKT
jgi:hypothetical protein